GCATAKRKACLSTTAINTHLEAGNYDEVFHEHKNVIVRRRPGLYTVAGRACGCEQAEAAGGAKSPGKPSLKKDRE
ncbi:hypothetical protein BHE74_00048753, partial [Ensete ventricosum]